MCLSTGQILRGEVILYLADCASVGNCVKDMFYVAHTSV